MNYKFDTHYIVIKGSDDGVIQTGDRLLLKFHKKKDEYSTLGEYNMFLPARKTQSDFFGLPPLNCVLYFHTKEELADRMRDVEIDYDLTTVKDLIDYHQKKIDKIKKNHEL